MLCTNYVRARDIFNEIYLTRLLIKPLNYESYESDKKIVTYLIL